MVKGVRRKNQPALMTLTERTTRFEVVIKIPDYLAALDLGHIRKLRAIVKRD